MPEVNDVRGGNFNARAVYAFAATLVFSLFLICLGLVLLFNWFARGRPGSRVQDWDRVKLTMPLEIDSGEPLAQLRLHEDAVLGGLGWVDRSAGIVHLPIEQAMDVFVSQTQERSHER